ncbi:ribosomal protection-like ABC-F family protein [Paenibacillus sp. RC67]|uniref:ribosomal protection-like ABC-F family protein n=1 Tax=Paenibacillus sp. RC67 TaxID=3039392 RepID=UPI0024AE200E|nr:ABC-F family ATP-binding cassette domain-containing protein [Paenibacillus sp. RC67]
MIILEAKGIEKRIGDRLLFKADHLRVGERDRIGIVGRNGAGKTSLLSILAGVVEPDHGRVWTSSSHQVIPQLKKEDTLQETTKSGGEITMLYIEQAFAVNPDIVFADEPTMNLDVERIKQLEQYFLNFIGAIVVISHDRTFLDTVCNVIWEVDAAKVTVYKGTYSDYYQQKQLEKRQHQERYEDYVRKRSDLERAVLLKQNKAQGMLKAPKRMSSSEAKLAKDKKGTTQAGVHQSIKALETRIEKLERVEKPREATQVKIDLPNELSFKNQTIIRLDRLVAKLEDRTLWQDVSLRIRFGEKVALNGANGSGKTTLLKKIINQEAGVHIAPGCKLGYFSQNLDILKPDLTIIDNVRASSIHPDPFIRTVLARLLFTRDDIYKRVEMLSGGERVRVAFAKIFLSDMNVLIMDEPTNFLDIESVEALEQLIKGYSGTVLFVSHDRQFVERTATRVLEITKEVVVSYDGTYKEYEESGKRHGAGQRDNDKEELLIVEMKLAEVMSKLGDPLTSARAKDDLEAEFQRLIQQRKELRTLIER